jgi:hypothetical protein
VLDDLAVLEVGEIVAGELQLTCEQRTKLWLKIGSRRVCGGEYRGERRKDKRKSRCASSRP